jgi:hypothetical protein
MSVPKYAERGGFRFDHHHILHRAEMQPFGAHQLAASFGPYEVLQPIFATSCGASLVRMGPGHVADEQGFSTEHILFPTVGSFRLRIADETHALDQHDLVFIPAFADFRLENADEHEWSEYLSINLRKDEWPGRRFLGDEVLRMEVRSSPEG